MGTFLKRFRVIFAILFFIGVLLTFLNITASRIGLPILLKIEFVPALISILAGGAIFLIILLLLTLLFGRVYCSFLCPLGILQDIITRIADFIYNITHHKKRRTSNKGYKKPHKVLRYIILIITGLFFAIGIITPLLLLDPYSIFGKIAVQIFETIEIGITNQLAGLFPYTFYYQEFFKLSALTFSYASICLIAIIIISAFKGRLYCNTICPVGTILGLIGSKSMFRPVINSDKCVQCNRCSLKCKSNCIDIKNKQIDTTRCVDCFNCVSACENGALKYTFSWGVNSKHTETDKGRRGAIIAFGALGTAIIARCTLGNKVPKTNKEGKGIMPPGAISIDHLKQNCTACQACAAACPSSIIKPATFEYGADGIMMPSIHYDNKFCGYECNKCSQTCPTGALQPLTLAQKKLTQIGHAVYYPKRCVVFIDGTDCGACDEHCPTKAITMHQVEGANYLYHPEVNQEICIGCGGCEYICPQSPKAIVVFADAIQLKAHKPTEDKQVVKEVDDFGF